MPMRSATISISLSALFSFFHCWIFSLFWCSLTDLRERSICPLDESTPRTLQTIFCPSRT